MAYLFWAPPPMLFLQLPPVHSSSTASPPDPDIRSRSSISTLLPCYFCSSRPSTARPPPVHRILTFALVPSSLARPPPVHRIRTFALAPPSLASSHAISAAPARPQPIHRPSTGSGHSLSLLSTARPPPVHRILTFALAPPSLASLHAISAAPARPQPVHRPSTGSGHSLSLLHL